MFYLALGYFLSYIPYAVLAEALSSDLSPGVDRPAGRTAMVIREAVRMRLREQFW